MGERTKIAALILLMTLATSTVAGIAVHIVYDVRPDSETMVLCVIVAIVGTATLIFGIMSPLISRFEEGKARLQAIVDTAADGIITTNEVGEIESLNYAAEEMFGYRPEVLIGQNFNVMLSSRYQDEEDGDFLDFLEINRIEALEASHEVVGLRKDGGTFYMDLSVSYTDLNDRRMFTIIVRDVTERKLARAALKKAHDGLELRVEERTADLSKSNAKLQAEIVQRKQAQKERERLIAELKDAIDKIKTLRGLIPICASCKKVRDDSGYWNQIEVYIRDRSDAEFSHSICPDCATKLYPEFSIGKESGDSSEEQQTSATES